MLINRATAKASFSFYLLCRKCDEIIVSWRGEERASSSFSGCLSCGLWNLLWFLFSFQRNLIIIFFVLSLFFKESSKIIWVSGLTKLAFLKSRESEHILEATGDHSCWACPWKKTHSHSPKIFHLILSLQTGLSIWSEFGNFWPRRLHTLFLLSQIIYHWMIFFFLTKM